MGHLYYGRVRRGSDLFTCQLRPGEDALCDMCDQRRAGIPQFPYQGVAASQDVDGWVLLQAVRRPESLLEMAAVALQPIVEVLGVSIFGVG